MLRELYAPFNRNHEKMIVMDVRSAELTKYAANCMLATKISFMNEMANLAEQLGADIEEVRKGIGSDPRIGYHFIYPGVGYGGSCFPKDVRALIHTAEGVKFDAKLLRAVEERNNAQKTVLFDKVNRYFKGDLKGKTFALWGLAFKPNTDDMREAPARVLMEALWEAGAKVQAYDPEAMQECQAIYGAARRPAALRHQGGGAARRRRADDRHRVEEFPRAGLRRGEGCADHAGDLRRPQPLRPEGHRPPRHRVSLDRQDGGVKARSEGGLDERQRGRR